MYDPFEFCKKVQAQVCRDNLRKYYRIARAGKWYGGIATADCCGCQLRCVFCWSGKPRDNPGAIGSFYRPQDVFKALVRCAKKHKYHQLRISGNEPTLHREHLISILRLVEQTSFTFILETNGLLIDREYARSLKPFRNLHVRVSIKGSTPEEFTTLTGAKPEFFYYQLDALKHLYEASVSCHPAVMLSITPPQNLERLKQELKSISTTLADEIEEEYIFLYPHVIQRLKQHGIEPLVAYSPEGIPTELI
ncbi:radical SAM protein [Candidatus Sumerlaeota bacterium]|nr:radical SAM protein [Candidatus Sumerlaeota bacterium]